MFVAAKFLNRFVTAVEATDRVLNMVNLKWMQEVLGYLLGACEVECPKDFIRLYCK
jgi:hypothetical protein